MTRARVAARCRELLAEARRWRAQGRHDLARALFREARLYARMWRAA